MSSERKILMIGVLFIVAAIIACIFISDWFFNRNLLTETLVGILIGTPLGWLGAYVAFYTVESNGKKTNCRQSVTGRIIQRVN